MAKARALYIGDIATNADVPDRILVFRDGVNEAKWDTGEELICIVDQQAADEIIREFTSRGRDMVCDYEHQTERPGAHPDGKAPAAGWVTGWEYVAGEGLYASMKWTKPAADEIKALQYRYFSPVFFTDANNRVVCITSLALTNSPALIGVRPIAAKSARETGEVKMKNVCTLLGLPETATEDQIVAAINKIKTSAPTEDSVAATLASAVGIDAKDKTAFVAAVNGMKGKSADIDPTKWVARADFDTVKAEVEKLKSKDLDNAREKFLASGQTAGKITANNRELWEATYKSDPAKASELLEKAPVLVTPGTLTSPTSKTSATEPTTRDAVIASAKAKFAGEETLRIATSCKAYVNDQLRIAKHAVLTEDEIKKLPA